VVTGWDSGTYLGEIISDAYSLMARWSPCSAMTLPTIMGKQ